jgi:hypothetical protein
MSSKTTVRVSHEDVKAVRRVVSWLDKIGRLDELQRVVGDDLANIADAALVTRAVVSIRALNAGAPPSDRKRRAAQASLAKARKACFGYEAPEWTPAQDDRLRHLWAQTDMHATEIAERLGRTPSAIQNRAALLGCRRAPGLQAAPRSAMGKVRAVVARRRQEEARRRREASA